MKKKGVLLALFFGLVFKLHGQSIEDAVWQLSLGENNATAFFIHQEGYLLTAAHNFWDGKSNGGIRKDWRSSTFTIKKKDVGSLKVKLKGFLCKSFYDRSKVCQEKNGVDIALLEVVEKNKLRDYDLKMAIPEVVLGSNVKGIVARVQIIGYNPQSDISSSYQIRSFKEVNNKNKGLSQFVRTNHTQWYTENINTRQIVPGFSGSPMILSRLDESNPGSSTVYRLVGVFVSGYATGKGFGEMSKNFGRLLLEMDLERTPKIIRAFEKVKALKFNRNEAYKLTNAEAFYLLDYIKNKLPSIGNKGLCQCYFEMQQYKNLNFRYHQKQLWLLDKNSNFDLRECLDYTHSKVEFAEMIFREAKRDIVDLELLKLAYDQFEIAKSSEFSNFNDLRKVSFYNSYASAGSLLGDITGNKSYYLNSISNYLKAGEISVQTGQSQYFVSENVALMYNKIGDYQNSILFYENAFAERSKRELDTEKIGSDILYVKGKIDNKTYDPTYLIQLDLNKASFDKSMWIAKSEEIQTVIKN